MRRTAGTHAEGGQPAHHLAADLAEPDDARGAADERGVHPEP